MIISSGDRFLIWLDMFSYTWARIAIEIMTEDSKR